MDLDVQLVRISAKLLGITLTRKAYRTQNSERNARMANMHKQGLTLKKIGQQFKLTRERVRQILKKMGVKACEGGIHVNVVAQRARTLKDRDARYQLQYGFPFEEVKKYRAKGLTHAFKSQQRNAAIRAIPFHLNFKQWITLWEASGKLELRGRGVGKYVMSRIRDDGCYEIGNVHIQLATENSREAVEKWRGKTKSHRGVFHLYPGRARAWRANVGKKVLGYFASEQEAVDVRAAYMVTHNIPDTNRLGKGRGYTVTKRGHFYMQAAGRKSTHKTADEARAAYLKACAEIVAERAGGVA